MNTETPKDAIVLYEININKMSAIKQTYAFKKTIQTWLCLFSFDVLTETCINVELKSIFTTMKSITGNYAYNPRIWLFYEVCW